MRDAGMRGCEDPKQLVAWLLLRQAGRLVQRMIDTVCDAVIAVTKQIGTVCDAVGIVVCVAYSDTGLLKHRPRAW